MRHNSLIITNDNECGMNRSTNLFVPLLRSLYDWYNWLVPLTIINALWFFLSLTLVAFPAATGALFKIALDVEQGHNPDVREFLQYTRQWLVKGWVWGASVLLLLALTLTALSFYAAQAGLIWSILLVISVFLAAWGWATLFYFWPYLLLQEQPMMSRALRNAALTVLAAPGRTLVYGGLSALLIALSILFILPLPVFTPILVALLIAYSLKGWLVRHRLLNAPASDGSEEDGEAQTTAAL
jgi:uncharacterized membrane protein YesL